MSKKQNKKFNGESSSALLMCNCAKDRPHWMQKKTTINFLSGFII